MKILLVGTYDPDRLFSMRGFADSMARALPAQGVDAVLLDPPVRLGRLRQGGRWAKWAGYADKYVLFPRELRRQARNFDLVHVLDQGHGLWVPEIADRPHLVTVHDLLALRTARGEFPDWTLSPRSRKFQEAIQGGLRQAQHVAVDSTATRDDFVRLYPDSPKPRVVPLGTLRPLARLPRAQALSLVAGLLPDPERPFLLQIGNNSPYKNRTGAIRIHRAMRRLDPGRTPRLVMAGHPLRDEIRTEAAEGLEDGTIVEAVRPTDAQVQALYSLAEGLLFPSFVEGFGLPVLEAQACGCPVFASDRAPLPEVGGDGAVYFDPTDVDGAARLILDAWNRCSEMVEAGHQNVAGRSPERMAAAYATAYREIL